MRAWSLELSEDVSEAIQPYAEKRAKDSLGGMIAPTRENSFRAPRICYGSFHSMHYGCLGRITDLEITDARKFYYLSQDHEL